MPFKPSYRFGRMERDRLKQAKKDDKLRRHQERKSQHDEPDATSPDENSPREHRDPV